MKDVNELRKNAKRKRSVAILYIATLLFRLAFFLRHFFVYNENFSKTNECRLHDHHIEHCYHRLKFMYPSEKHERFAELRLEKDMNSAFLLEIRPKYTLKCHLESCECCWRILQQPVWPGNNCNLSFECIVSRTNDQENNWPSFWLCIDIF